MDSSVFDLDIEQWQKYKFSNDKTNMLKVDCTFSQITKVGISVNHMFPLLWLIHTARDRERDRDQDRDGYNRKQWLPVPVPLPV